MLKERIAVLKLDVSHLLGAYIVRRRLSETKIPLSDILVEHSPYPRFHLKPRRIAAGLLENTCAICGLAPAWEGKYLVLAMDHINGVKDDHRLENLRIVCPNCHSQTDTFASRNFIKQKQREAIPVKSSVKRSYPPEPKKSFAEFQIPLEKLFAANSKRNSGSLKKRLLQENLLPYKCVLCGRGPEWQGKELVLVSDHINGRHDDNRLENLRFLCPNCHSQTDTFAGKHIPKPKKKYTCQGCGAGITKFNESGFCRACVSKSQRKVERPPHAIIAKLVQEHGFSEVGRRFGVSDNASRKWLRQ